jgi:hypothetical protein
VKAIIHCSKVLGQHMSKLEVLTANCDMVGQFVVMAVRETDVLKVTTFTSENGACGRYNKHYSRELLAFKRMSFEGKGHSVGYDSYMRERGM